MNEAIKFIDKNYPSITDAEKLMVIDAYMSGMMQGYKQNQKKTKGR